MLDKDSRWSHLNGLSTLVTTLLQMSFAGYPFILPDMIGGNGYGIGDGLDESTRPDKELYIRWLQANVFMPAMQFSFTPWGYGDPEVTAHALEMSQLHAAYADDIVALAKDVFFTGEPINRPIWWLDPDDDIALTIDDGKTLS